MAAPFDPMLPENVSLKRLTVTLGMAPLVPPGVLGLKPPHRIPPPEDWEKLLAKVEFTMFTVPLAATTLRSSPPEKPLLPALPIKEHESTVTDAALFMKTPPARPLPLPWSTAVL